MITSYSHAGDISIDDSLLRGEWETDAVCWRRADGGGAEVRGVWEQMVRWRQWQHVRRRAHAGREAPPHFCLSKYTSVSPIQIEIPRVEGKNFQHMSFVET